ncbi:hypothetical protein [Verrucomicrobium spinosum]|uniref:hypothetical protein n=1 Tax=Verrucomicrobium spinosum TaxID=2736 RepID=UPI0009462128|nr:hypothetical protein [Verrucomicrobium spinosum]
MNAIYGDTHAAIMDSGVTAAGDVDLDATNVSIIDAEVRALSASVAISGSAGIGVALGASIATNLIGGGTYRDIDANGNVTTASLDKEALRVSTLVEDSTINTGGRLEMTTLSQQTILSDAQVATVSLSLGASFAVAASAAGTFATNAIETDVSSNILRSAVQTALGVDMDAHDRSIIDARQAPPPSRPRFHPLALPSPLPARLPPTRRTTTSGPP